MSVVPSLAIAAVVMAARLYLLEVVAAEERRERAAQRRQLREFFLTQHLPDKEFVNTFRLTPELLETLCLEVIPLLSPKQNSRGIDPTAKILITLKLYGRGDYQGGVGRDDAVPMAQQTVSDCVREVTNALNSLDFVRRHIHFPQNRAERGEIKRRFYSKYGLPGVCGAIDCTHVAIHRPVLHEERFFNRKHFHSLNVQMICDEVNIIRNVDASYGGATHDSFIWDGCEIKAHLEALCGTGETAVLLGDSGYPLREYLMTPVDGATEGSPEGQYNILQKRARSIIERTFGILKGRWRCLLAARELYYTPEMAGKMTIACSALHNMCVEARLEPIELDPIDVQNENELQQGAQYNATAPSSSSSTAALRHGREARAQIIRNIFSFYSKYGLPGVCGAIDCTHVAIHRPVLHEERFFNRKHFHSLNVQMICDEVNIIRNVDASYGGATHDSFIWDGCEIKAHLEALCGTGETAVLLGDSGYPLREYLMTPVDGATEGSPEGQYNILQKRARSIIERTFGILKGRWRCLLAARELYYTPEMAGKMTIACSALHNMCVEARLEPIELDPIDVQNENELQQGAQYNATAPSSSSSTAALRHGREARAQIIRNIFS